ncbi:MAG: ABC transporter ATP-binding protein [Candidatus Aminicenantes bacterium]|nr:ABC transporter ATP-binding protein [Candidatus Aminicenantes bacterium]
MKDLILNVKKLKKSFIQPDGNSLPVISGLSFELGRGKILAVTGVSGSGKSTLLHLLGSFDHPDSGEIIFENESINSFSKEKLVKYRNEDIGFLYQFHYLMPELTILENVSFPFLIKSFDRKKANERAGELLDRVGLNSKKSNMPYELSGGEKQRAAIARSLINSPKLLLADEPTGNLDKKTGEKVFELFSELIKDEGLSAIVVTHNEALANTADKILHLN